MEERSGACETGGDRFAGGAGTADLKQLARQNKLQLTILLPINVGIVFVATGNLK